MPLDESDRRTIEKLEEKLRPIEEQMRPLEAQAQKWRVAINSVLEAAGEEARYSVETSAPLPCADVSRLRPYGRAEFFGQPLATVVARILGERGALNEHELYDLMLSGGYDFKADVDRAKANLKISLGKNSKFSKTGNGYYVVAPSARRVRINPAILAEMDAAEAASGGVGGDAKNTPAADGPGAAG